MLLNQPVNKWFEEKGITGSRISKFISDVMPLLITSPVLGPEQINDRLDRIGWKGLHLDESSLKLITDGFEQAGCMGSPPSVPIEDTKGLNQLLEKIYRERGVDFREYAKTSLARRVSRRMKARKAGSYSEYMAVLDQDSDEYLLLFDDLPVNVTRFFRNPAAFAGFKRAVETTMASKEEKTLRIWSAGCATGQEPYSIAMLTADTFETSPGWDFTVLATDIDTKALEIAQKGIFDQNALKEVPQEWQSKYFSRDRDLFKIREAVQDKVVFKRHNIISDSSFGEQDIVVCRNVLIYFNLSLQMRVARLFDKALNPRGYLLLGRYEMLLKEARRLFSCVDFDARLYRKKI